MKSIFTNFLFLILLSYPILSQVTTTDHEYQDIIKAIQNLHVVSQGEIPAGGVVIVKDAATFKLNSGTIYRFSTVVGKESFLLFKGIGQFMFVPQSKVEQEQLERFYEKKSLNEKFNSLFLVFADTANLSYFTNINFRDSDSPDYRVSDYEYPISYLLDTDAGYFDTDFMYAFLEKKNNSLFYAHTEFEDFERLFFRISPYNFEEVNLSRKASGAIGFSRETDLVSSFHLNNNYSSSLARKQTLNVINIPQYKINLDIDDNLDVNGECELTFTLNQPQVNWVKLYLYHELQVDSVEVNHLKNTFYRGEDNPELWIKLPDIIDRNDNNSLKIYYHGDLLEKDELDWVATKSSIFWYPYNPNRLNSYFEMNFKYPAKYELVSIGEQISNENFNDYKKSCWRTKSPTRNASFNIGHFEKYEFTEEGVPKVSVFISPSSHSKMSNMLVKYEILSGANMEEKIGADVLASLEYFQKVFGEISLNEINVTEIPYFRGEAFLGLVHLSWYNYQGAQYDKSGELMRAHEVAHQWWGIGVDFEDYHDQWLSEGFAQFSALYFIQAAFGKDDYFDVLNRWKKNILSSRKYLFGEGQKAGPIWLGYRTHSSETEGDYNTIVYEKGAWVMHMLRNLLLDLKTMKEDKFEGLMKEFFKSYYGKKATLDDFIKIVNKYSDENLDWFFDQFVYGTGIPEYRFSYISERNPDGKIFITCKVIQNNVPEDFKMYVPIKIVFSENKVARLRLLIRGKEGITKFALSEAPKEIIFNDLNSVLCKVY